MERHAPSLTVTPPRSTGRCAATGGELLPGEAYYATLVEGFDEDNAEGSDPTDDSRPDPPAEGRSQVGLGLARVDVSLDAWEGGYRPEGVFCYWKTTAPEPNAKRRLFVDDAVLMNLFRRLEGDELPRRRAFRFVLALILMRKRLLRYDRTVERDGDLYWTLTPKLDLSKGPMGKWDESEQFDVLDPGLAEGEIEGVTAELGQVLEGGGVGDEEVKR